MRWSCFTSCFATDFWRIRSNTWVYFTMPQMGSLDIGLQSNVQMRSTWWKFLYIQLTESCTCSDNFFHHSTNLHGHLKNHHNSQDIWQRNFWSFLALKIKVIFDKWRSVDLVNNMATAHCSREQRVACYRKYYWIHKSIINWQGNLAVHSQQVQRQQLAFDQILLQLVPLCAAISLFDFLIVVILHTDNS